MIEQKLEKEEEDARYIHAYPPLCVGEEQAFIASEFAISGHLSFNISNLEIMNFNLYNTVMSVYSE